MPGMCAQVLFAPAQIVYYFQFPWFSSGASLSTIHYSKDVKSLPNVLHLFCQFLPTMATFGLCVSVTK